MLACFKKLMPMLTYGLAMGIFVVGCLASNPNWFIPSSHCTQRAMLRAYCSSNSFLMRLAHFLSLSHFHVSSYICGAMFVVVFFVFCFKYSATGGISSPHISPVSNTSLVICSLLLLPSRSFSAKGFFFLPAPGLAPPLPFAKPSTSDCLISSQNV